METKTILAGELDVYSNKADMLVKVGSVITDDFKSGADFIKALQQIGDLDNGEYSVHRNAGLFARFDVKNKRISGLHRASKNTGIIMPCWDYFKE